MISEALKCNSSLTQLNMRGDENRTNRNQMNRNETNEWIDNVIEKKERG